MKKSEYIFPKMSVRKFNIENVVATSGVTAENKLKSAGALNGTEKM